jgi:hypothetical protein
VSVSKVKARLREADVGSISTWFDEPAATTVSIGVLAACRRTRSWGAMPRDRTLILSLVTEV